MVKTRERRAKDMKENEENRHTVVAVKKKKPGRKPKRTILKEKNGDGEFPKKRGRKPKPKLPESLAAQNAYKRDLKFIDFTAALRVFIRTEPVDAERCLGLLQQLNTLPVTSMMMLRWPQCVDFIRNLSLKKPRLLNRKYPEIKSLAEAVLKRCLNVFYYKGDEWMQYRAEAKEYAAITKKMTVMQKLKMSRCAFNRLRKPTGNSQP